MKNIKEYLNLYLGCDVYLTIDDFHFPHTYPLTVSLLNEIYNSERRHEVELILRPLSDMTEEEMLQCGNMVYDFTDDDSGLNLNEWEWTDFQTLLDATQFHYLLSKHFDIFGLIEDGLAINATELNAVSER